MLQIDVNVNYAIGSDNNDFMLNGYILRMSVHVLRYKVCREVSHILLQRNRIKRRRD